MNAKLAELKEKHEALRQEIIKNEGEISIYKQYPELDAIAHEMFMILSGGKNEIKLSAEWVKANAIN